MTAGLGADKPFQAANITVVEAGGNAILSFECFLRCGGSLPVIASEDRFDLFKAVEIIAHPLS